MNEFMKNLQEEDAKRAVEREVLHGINPNSYLGHEILKQRDVILEIRDTVDELLLIFRKLSDTKNLD